MWALSPRTPSNRSYCRWFSLPERNRRLTMGRLFVHGGDDRIEDVEELLPLGGRKHGKQARIRGSSTRLGITEAFPALRGELDGVRPAILLGALAMNEPSRQQSRHNIGEG